MSPNMWYSSLLRHLLTLLLTALLGGLLGATLVRFGPGFGVDERELDTRLHEDSIQALRRSHSEERNLFHFYASYLNGAVHGNLGVSHSFARPVTQLFAERLPVTLRTVAVGLASGWLLGLLLALPAATLRGWRFDFFASSATSAFLCLPSAGLAIFFFFFGGPLGLAVCSALFPPHLRHFRNLLVPISTPTQVLTARA